MKTIESQVEVNAYVSEANNLCIAVSEYEDLPIIDGMQVIVIKPENAERFILMLNDLFNNEMSK